MIDENLSDEEKFNRLHHFVRRLNHRDGFIAAGGATLSRPSLEELDEELDDVAERMALRSTRRRLGYSDAR